MTPLELSAESRVLAGILLLTVITIQSGGYAMLAINTGRKAATDLQRRFFRAGHAHAGVFVTLALVTQVLVDAADVSGPFEWLARYGVAWAAILLPAGFFLSVARPGSTRPNALIHLVHAGAAGLALGTLSLGVGLLLA
jgi:hypothetical protein